MHRKRDAEVLVVGAGPVGLLAAARLAKRGVDVHVIDRDWREAGFSYALGLHPDSLAILKEMNLDHIIAEEGYRVQALAFYDKHEPRAHLDFSRLDVPHPYITIFPQNRLETLLLQSLKENNVKVQWKHELVHFRREQSPIESLLQRWGEDMSGYGAAEKVRVIESQFPFRSQFILGADGHDSQVRPGLGLEYQTTAIPQYFAVFEFETDFDSNHEARVSIADETINVLWPLPDGKARWGFQLKPSDTGGLFADRRKSRLSGIASWITPGLGVDRLQSLIETRAPWFSGDIKQLVWSVPVRFQQRVVPQFGADGVWLAGDAAHLAHPVGLQSMNMGLLEGFQLAEIMHSVLHENASKSLLLDYSKRQVSVWQRLLNSDGNLQIGDDANPFVRKHFDRILAGTPATGHTLASLLSQLGLIFDPGTAHV